MLGKKLKKLVQSSDKSNAYIAEYLGCSVNNLYNFYKKNSLDSEVITKSCELFNVPLSYFLGEIAENIQVSKNLDIEDNKESSMWSRKYLEVQEKVNKLQDEISKAKDEVSKVKSEFIEFQKEAYKNQMEAFQKVTSMSLGKAKASSNNKTTLPKNEKLNLFSLNF